MQALGVTVAAVPTTLLSNHPLYPTVRGRVLDATGAVLLAQSDPSASFDGAAGRIEHKFDLAAGARTEVCLKIPYVPDAKGLLAPASSADFAAVHREVSAFWSGLLAKGATIDVPEPRINDVWRAYAASLDVEPELRAALVDPSRVWDACSTMADRCGRIRPKRSCGAWPRSVSMCGSCSSTRPSPPT